MLVSKRYAGSSSGARSAIASAWGTVLAILFFLPASSAWGQSIPSDPGNQGLGDEQRREATLQWLDQYLTESQLMRAEDIKKIRGAIEQMSSSQLQQWLQQTEQLRQAVESPRWQETKQWLKTYLRVQSTYSDEEIEKLRRDIYNADAQRMLEILQRIQTKHDSLVWMHEASQQARASEVAQHNSRTAAQAAAASQARSTGAGSVPLFGSGVAKSEKPSTGYRPPAPLINSRDVARAAVWSEAWGGRGW